MRIAVCDDQMEVLNAIEDILKNAKDSNIESVEIYQDIRHLKKELHRLTRAHSPLSCAMDK